MGMRFIYQKTILVFISLCFYSLINAQSCTDVKELLRKRHTIKGMTYGHPYTTFDRHNENYKNLDNAIDNIRKNILKDKSISTVEELRGPVYKAYKAIYNNAVAPMPDDHGIITIAHDDKSYLAIWAKNNAFVFLIGLDGFANPLDTPNHKTRRNQHRDNALDAFSNLTDNVKPHDAGSISFYNSDDTNMQHYARSLIYWLQAYDLLKAAYDVKELRDSSRNPWGFGDADANKDGSCSPRRKLRNYARNVYTRSKDFDGIVEHYTGWKKNHGIACASSLLMAAQVLNDAGVETNFFTGILGWLWGEGYVTPYPKYSPVKWNELGQKGLEENLFVGNHWWWLSKDVPVALSKTWESYSPYSEGTHYTHYGLLDCGILAMVAQKNIYQHLNKKHLTLGIAYIENLNHV